MNLALIRHVLHSPFVQICPAQTAPLFIFIELLPLVKSTKYGYKKRVKSAAPVNSESSQDTKKWNQSAIAFNYIYHPSPFDIMTFNYRVDYQIFVYASDRGMISFLWGYQWSTYYGFSDTKRRHRQMNSFNLPVPTQIWWLKTIEVML